ncbi:helicase DnaB [Paenibacillus thalictri]|uniref:Helicase DnaB n=1 Tax=Paenibacillus thalictri TaxID=2527873 RepID=A0A4Q9DGV6_9BACL|nr:helicase DnaB [Paenibacillus thalictri]TBL71509.1 helicase DnaB [Paenibacillus thalictri]
MRMTNMLHFTENHRFRTVRAFSLSPLDQKVLSCLYQPMIGAVAIGLYYTLFHQLPADRAGTSALEHQRKLFLALELEPGERGRKFLAEQASKLEAIGLMQTYRKYVQDLDDYIYEYELLAPQVPAEFFKNQHLTLLLRDKIGKHAVLALREEMLPADVAEIGSATAENLSMPFYELFRLNTQVIDLELEQAQYETAASRPAAEQQAQGINVKGFSYAEIIMRFPKESVNRGHVERLKFNQEQLTKLNFFAKKYGLTLGETCRLLDEDGAFDADGQLSEDFLQRRASLVYRQDKKRSEDRERLLARMNSAAEDEQSKTPRAVEMEFYLEVPDIFQGECNQHQYNYILRNEPYTYLLEKIFSKGTVPDGLLDVFTKIDLNYGLSEEVINVMIHFIYVNKRSWAKSSLESTASDMLGKQVQTFEQAVHYVRDANRYKEKPRGGRLGGASSAPGASSGKGRVNQKPVIPIVQNREGVRELTKDEREQMQSIIRKLGGSLKL